MQLDFPGGAATNNDYGSIPAANVPAWLYTNSFTFRCWAYRDTTATTSKAICFAQNLFLVSMTDVVARLSIMDDGAATIVHSTVSHTNYNQEWVFICGSWNRSTNAITVVVRSESKARTAGTNTKTPGTHTPGSLFWGKNKLSTDGSSAITAQAWDGPILGMMISEGAATQAQLEALCDAAWADLGGDQGSLKDPTIPITFEGTGIGGLLNPKYIAPMAIAPQTIDGTPSFDGARIGSAITTAKYNVLVNDGNTSYNNVESNVLCQYQTNAVVGTGVILQEPDPTFFGKPSPALGTDGNNGVASNLARRLHDNTPSGVEIIDVVSNSRSAVETGYDNGPAIFGEWAGNHAHGHAASRIAKLGGWAFSYVHYQAQKRYHAIFPYTSSGPRQSGSFTNTHNAGGTYSDFSRDATGSGIASSTGPGRGIVFTSTGATLSQRATRNTNTLFTTTGQWLHAAFYEKYPGSPDSFSWVLEDAADTTSAGSTIASGSVTGCNTALQTHTYNTGTDSYNAGTKTLTLVGLTTTGLAVGHYVFTATSKSRGKIASITPGGTVTIVLEFALKSTPANGEILHFGPYSWGILTHTVNAPSGGNICQGYSITSNTDFCWLGVTAHAVGIDCWVFGSSGKNGGGYVEQLTTCHSGTIAYRVSRVGYTGMILHGATQDSTNADRMSYAAASGLSAPNCILCSDQVHKITDTTLTGTFNTDALAQTTYPAIVATNYCGSLIWQLQTNKLRNPAHPAPEGHKMLADGLWGDASSDIPIEPEPEPDEPLFTPLDFPRSKEAYPRALGR